jgi:16S rRNA processing protein RimM
MKIMTDYPERLVTELKMVYIGTDANQMDAEAYTIQSARFHKDFLLLTLEDINSRDDAESFRNQLVMIDMEHAVPLDEDEVYLYELIGLTVKTSDDKILGTIKDVLETGANDVYVVRSREYGELLIPIHAETLIEIDTEAETVIVNLPEGLLPKESE